MPTPTHEQRTVSHSQFGDKTTIHQEKVQGNIYYGLPHSPAPAEAAEVVRVIPYPRNEDLVHRQDLIEKLDKLLPRTPPDFFSAALWGLGGSGKTQIALDYAYRRCDNDDECCIFWVHADSEATFTSDYKTIGKKLAVDDRLDGSDLLEAVRSKIETRSRWVMVLDNADDLELFGVGRPQRGNNKDLRGYVPHASQGTVLWTSRDAHIAGTLVGSRRGIEVRSMEPDEATLLLARARNEELTSEEGGVNSLLESLQHLPLAISQAGAYMRCMSMTVEEYLSLLAQGKTRWEVLKWSDFDRHRRPKVSNSVLETWRISIEQIRAESEISYQILHVIAYVDSQDIPQELMAAAAGRNRIDDEGMQLTDLDVRGAITRLVEFSFLGLRQNEEGGCSYEMHKLVQEAIRYGLRMRGPMETGLGEMVDREGGLEKGEAYYSSVALQIVSNLFPVREGKPWVRCGQYMAHAIQVGEWAKVSGREADTARLLSQVSGFLYNQGRWREKETVDKRAWDLRREVLGERHPDTISSMASLATTYHEQGRYNEAEQSKDQALNLRREILGEKHPDTIRSMASLAATYHAQGRYDKAEGIYQEVLDLRREILGEKHPDTISSMADLAATYHAQGRYDEDEEILVKVLDLRREILGEKHPDTIRSIADLAATYHTRGRYDEAEILKDRILDLRREILGEKHPDTIRSMASLAATYHAQGRYDKAEGIYQGVLDLRREILGEKHPDTISSMASLAATYHAQGRYDEAEVLHKSALDLRRQILGENHPDTSESVVYLASTQESLQHIRSLARPVQSLAVTQADGLEERKPRQRSLREIMSVKVKSFQKWRSHKGSGSD